MAPYIDEHIISNPEVTFFKKIFKKNTKYYSKFQQVYPNQQPEYNSNITFNIPDCDLLHRCYLEIELPELQFLDNIITSTDYKNIKEIELNNYLQKQSIEQNIFNILEEYCNIEILLYKQLMNILLIDNILLNDITNTVQQFEYKYNTLKMNLIGQIDQTILNEITISNYTNNLNQLNIDEIKRNLNNIYEKIHYYLNFYTNNLVNINNKINDNKNGYIDFKFCNKLGHNYFQKFTINIGSKEISSYTSDILDIHQVHTITPDMKNTYDKLIGNTNDLNNFNGEIKGNKKIIVPLKFWFNDEVSQSLPVVALRHTDVFIDIKLNDLYNIIIFNDFEKNYDDLLQIKIPLNSKDNFIVNNKLIFNDYKFDYENGIVTYNCKYINNELLKLQFLELTDVEITEILTTRGTFDLKYNQYVLSKFNWINIMNNIKQLYNSNNYYYKISSYYPFIDFNLLYNKIALPQIKLICETIYLNDYERNLFANNKLEYIIKTYNENTFYTNNKEYFNCDLSFNNLCSDLYWYIHTSLNNNKISKYGQLYNLQYDLKNYIDIQLIEDQKLLLDKEIANSFNIELQSYKYLNNTLPDGLNYVSFSLYPEYSTPSGCINFNYFKSKYYYVVFNDDYIKELEQLIEKLEIEYELNFTIKFVSRNYDILIISNGTAKTIFSY